MTQVNILYTLKMEIDIPAVLLHDIGRVDGVDKIQHIPHATLGATMAKDIK